MRNGRAALAACCLALAALGMAALHRGEPPAPDATPQQQSAEPPPGTLLIASAQIGDPRFHHAVVLLLRHDKDGAFGIFITHPFPEETIAKRLEATGDDAAGFEGSVRVFLG